MHILSDGVTELTGKQKRHLRGLGQRMSVAASTGSAGLTEEFAAHLHRLFGRSELIKVRLGEEYTGADRKNAAAKLENLTGSTCVGIVGRTVLLYRPNETLPDQERISLPKR
jgi:RNA-binding protein